MKYFLILLLGLISSLSSAQDVVIPAEVARHYLEQDDRVKILTEKDSINLRVISISNQELQVKQSIIDSYQKDSLTFRSILANKDQQIALNRDELIAANKIISTQRFEVCLFAGTTSGVIIGSVIPAIGTIGGGVIGGITGCGVYGIHKIKQLFKR